MDARYPSDAIAFGNEVRAWLRDNLPDRTDRESFMAEWTKKLFDGVSWR